MKNNKSGKGSGDVVVFQRPQAPSPASNDIRAAFNDCLFVSAQLIRLSNTPHGLFEENRGAYDRRETKRVSLHIMRLPLFLLLILHVLMTTRKRGSHFVNRPPLYTLTRMYHMAASVKITTTKKKNRNAFFLRRRAFFFPRMRVRPLNYLFVQPLGTRFSCFSIFPSSPRALSHRAVSNDS